MPIPILIILLALLVGVSITLLMDPSPRIPATKGPATKGPATKGPATKGPATKGPVGKRQVDTRTSERPKQALAATALFGIGLLMGGVIFGSLVIAVPFACLLATTPTLIRGSKRRRSANAITQAWPDAIDHLSSAIRAGLNLAESLTAIGLRGPIPLRPYFIALGNDLAASTSLESALTRFSIECADPIADQLVETVLIAHEVGGSEIGRLLRTFSQFLRLELQTRDEIRVRQGWVVNGARIAAAAPWILLALLSLRRESVATYQSAGGIFIILVGAVLTVVAYLWMRRLSHLGGMAS